jgi:ketosteroid isomerase-like protein
LVDNAARIAASYFAAWHDKDFPTLRSLLSEEFEYWGPLARHTSPEACRESLEKLAPITTAVAVNGVFVAGDEVTTWFDLHTTVAGPTPVANRMRVAAGKITAIHAVYDPRELLGKQEDGK